MKLAGLQSKTSTATARPGALASPLRAQAKPVPGGLRWCLSFGYPLALSLPVLPPVKGPLMTPISTGQAILLQLNLCDPFDLIFTNTN
jgi:hypothetical protein